MNWYFEVLRKFATFDGRARRMEYWTFCLINLVITIAIMFVEGMLGFRNEATGYGILSALYALVLFLPSLAVTVRRLHDTDRSGFWIFFAIIPILGWLVFLYFMLSGGTAGQNSYGADPKA